MIDFVYGRTGTGKSAELFSRAEKSAVGGRRVFILVPDRDAVAAESRASVLSGAGNIDVVTFRRLANYIFRSLGGICENYIGAGAKKVIMHGVLADLSPRLKDLGGVAKTDLRMTEKLVKARSEMMRNDIEPEALSDAAGRLAGKTAAKLSDLSLIFSEFDRAVAEKWKDPDGMLSAASSLEKTAEFFVGCDVYIDAFTAFTSQQYGLLEKIFKGADNVCVSVAYEPDLDKNEPAFMTIENTDRTLRETAAKVGAAFEKDTILRVPTRFESDELSFLSSHLWSSSRAVRASYDKKTENINIVSAATVYSEAEAVAVDICRKLRDGSRLRDIAVITRSTDEYKGVIDAVFEKYGIPYFVSEKTDISEMSLIKFVTAALAVARHGFMRDDVIAYIKTDLSGVSGKDAFDLENFIIKWNVNGKRFTDGDFLENPRGMREDFTDDDKRLLDSINASRRAVTKPLTDFAGVLKNQTDVRGFATVLFDFLSSLSVPERLFDAAERAKERGDLALCSTEKKLWRAFCDALDLLVSSVGDRKCDLEEFSIYLDAMLSETDIGRIPTAVDRVLIADAVLTSVPNVKNAYVIGCFAGGFPHRVGEDGIFSEQEKSELESVGVEISSRLWKKLSDELFFFYTAVSAPSKTLMVTYPRTDPEGEENKGSEGVSRIRALFPNISETSFENTPKADLIWNRGAAFEYAVHGGALGEALCEYYSNVPEYAERLKYSSEPLSASKCKLDEETAREIFGTEVSISPTRLEKFVKCRFSYFCEYEMKLADNREQKFSALNIGTLIHKIMEVAVKYTVNNPEAPDDEVERIIRKTATDEMALFLRAPAGNKMRHVVDYLCKTAFEFVADTRAEMKQSKFRPVPNGFELLIGDGGIEPVTLSGNGVSVKIHGKIDRVDAYDDGDGTMNILVSDYKTGNKAFSLQNVGIGLDMQMLLYLFSIWEKGEKYFKKKIAPAGIVYVNLPSPEAVMTIDKKPDMKPKKSGLFVSDIKILSAMDENLDGEFIPVKASDIKAFCGAADKSGTSKKKTSKKEKETKETPKNGPLISREELGELKGRVADKVLDFVGELCRGIAYAEPYTEKKGTPCSYCAYRAVCRRAKVADEENDEEN